MRRKMTNLTGLQPTAKPGNPKGQAVVLNPKVMHRKSLIDEVLYSGHAPLEIFLRVMKGDTSITPMQLKAAELAAPYVHPKLATISVTGRFRSDMTRPDSGPPTVDEEGNDVGLPADPLEAMRAYQRLLGEL